ncbi:MAG: DUF1189 family protein [Lachnospiraceae bacterium]|nr:DUF1189 family protein [Lachnospiraceae bacterium]
MESKRVSFTEQIRIALSRPLKYQRLFHQTAAQHVWYFVVLLALVTVIQCVIPMTAFIKSSGGLESVAYEVIPQFSLDQGQLYVASVIDHEMAGVRLIIDTSYESFDTSDAISVANTMDVTMPVIYLVSRTNIACNTVSVPLSLSTIDLTLDNGVLYRYAPVIIGVILAGFLIRTVVSYIISALFFAFFGMVLNKVLGLKLKFGEILLIALYAKSVEIILAAVLEVLGYTLLYYVGTIIGIFITCSYITKGMTSLILRNRAKDQNDKGNFMDYHV